MADLTPRVVLEIAYHEAIVRQAYRDSEGIWTWSAGITSKSGHRVEGYIGNPQPMRRCLEVYIWLLRTKYLPEVIAVLGDKLAEHELAGALSFHWNTGAIRSATWASRWKKRDIAGAREAFMWFNKPAAIIRRREAERDLFFAARWSGKGTIGEYTRLTPSATPVWSSQVERDIRADVAELLKGQAA
ncbi:hypothetical protein D2T31_00650 [Sinirhodobacter populi]|uniref:Lysozyme n=1 Tax=Paenirhodobacter populi TaxID=2306993 RepID=A0A443KIE2_9RHOB|nr:hypothetical protein [Sinirhodobacter populi]RWR32527.1 hypothetical protein D2T31_00650 [Sinirhodobacter populi]